VGALGRQGWPPWQATQSVVIVLTGPNRSESQILGQFGVYDMPTAEQNASLKWLIDGLVDSLKISRSEIFRHPVMSWKNPTEAAGAKW
jgi:hypothetical protein